MKNKATLSQNEAESSETAYRKALLYLQYHDYSEYMIKNKLKSFGFTVQASEGAVERLLMQHYVDDRRYSQNYLRLSIHGKSLNVIKNTLRQRGISDEIIDEIFEDMCEEDSNPELPAIEKYVLSKLNAGVDREHIFASLARRGYGLSQIKKTLDKLTEEQDEQ